MKNFAIRDIENLSGIKAHTLRIWEHRYDFIKPRRNTVNFRYYTIDEVGRLLNIALLTKNGFRISHVSTMGYQEVANEVNKLPNALDQQQKAINDLVVSMYTLDPVSFEATIDVCLQKWPVEQVIQKIILVFLNKTGLLWQGNRLPEEHFVVTIIRKKIISAIDQINVSRPLEKKVLLYLPDGKQLDLVLLYTHYLLKSKGIQVLYLGRDVSIANIKTVVQLTRPDWLYTYMPQKNKYALKDLSAFFAMNAPSTKMVMSTYPDKGIIKLFENISVMPLEKVLEFLVHQPAL